MDLKTLDPKSILFVGGKNFNIPKDIRPQIRLAQWEQDDERYSSPTPAPDLVVLLTQWASHSKIAKGREYAKVLNIPCLEAGSKSDMVKRAEQEGLDISGIFERKTKEILIKRKQCKRIEGKLKEFLLEKAAEFNMVVPLKAVDASQLKELAMLEMEYELNVVQIQRVLRVAYRSGIYPSKSSVRQKPETKEEKPTLVSPKLEKASVSPPPIEKFTLGSSMEAIFKKLFEMHDKIVVLTEERYMYSDEVMKLTAENKILKEKLDKLSKIESVLASYSGK